MKYDPAAIEQRWQDNWEQHQTFRTSNPGDDGFDPAKPKYYVLDMFPYPSGAGLHVGHPLGYIATDIIARYKRMTGHNVLHPMGYDAFGLPAEQYAIEHGIHPRVTTAKNIQNMTRQLKRLGLSYDWDRSLATTDTGYYRWTQWVFLQLYNSWFDPSQDRARPISELIQRLESEQDYVGSESEIIDAGANEGLDALAGTPIGVSKWHELSVTQQRDVLDNQRLAYMAQVPVNWCPALGTVLANEEVTNQGKSERGNHRVYKRPLKQWMLRITAYAPRLLTELGVVDWPEPIKIMQRNWIGRSEGALVHFTIADPGSASPNPIDDTSLNSIAVYTTRPDTLFGATYLVLAPEHPIVTWVTTDSQRHEVDQYCQQAASKTDADRQTNTKQKTGIFTGCFVINPVNDEKIPVWIADYVMMGYGTGAIMAVPAHDPRDFEFAQQFNLPIQDVVYTPALAAIHAYCHRADGQTNPTDNQDPTERIADFVGLCISQSRTDYDRVWQIINQPRSTDLPSDQDTQGALEGIEIESDSVADKPTAQGSLVTDGGDRRGSIALVWLDQLSPLVDFDLPGLIADAKAGQLIQRLGNAVTEPGVNVHSTNDGISLNGLHTPEAKKTITDWLQANGLGEASIQYKLRDWLFSRQRYWGEPFPILHGPDGEIVALDEQDLPLDLPEVYDFKPQTASDGDDPGADPKPPLSRAPDTWKYVDRGGVRYTRELNTMPQWAGSCWYYLRFCDPHNADQFVSQEAQRYWMGSQDQTDPTVSGGIDLYVGGAEHAVLHLLYARFWHKVLYDLGHVSTPEPFGRLFNQGYIQAHAYTDDRGVYVLADQVQEKDSQWLYQGEPVTQHFGKMGKSLKNSVTPDEICDQYGCDTLRLYEMYLGPLDQSKVWRTRDIVGVNRFLHRLWRNFIDPETGKLLVTDDPPADTLNRKLHKTIKRVTDAMDNLSFNVAIAALIELNNDLVALAQIPRCVAQPMVLCLSPIAPHIAEELWHQLGHEQSLAHHPWPAYDPKQLVEDEIQYPIAVNGKLKARITISAEADNQAIEQAALAEDKVQAAIGSQTVKKVIIVKAKMVNVVVKG